MTTLLVLRERIKKLYARYGGIVMRVFKFLLAFAAFFAVNRTIGYMEKLNKSWLAVLLAAACAFLPNGVTVVVVSVYVLAQMYAVSLEVFFVVAAVFLLFFCLYYVFQPGNSILLVLIPLLFVCRLPLVVPMILGLVGTAFGVIPVSFGVIIYYMLKFVRDNVGLLASNGSLSMPGRYTQMIDGILGNRQMWVMVAACCAALLVVYVIRRLSVSHSWEIAIVAGTVTNIVLIFVGVFVLDVTFPVVTVIVSAVCAAGCSLVLEFFVFHLDYSRTEYVQFEDDDYYYYVKAVPKVAVTQPEVTVTKINSNTPDDKAVEEELFTLRRELGNTAEILTAGKDLEETRELFRERQPDSQSDPQPENQPDSGQEEAVAAEEETLRLLHGDDTEKLMADGEVQDADHNEDV